MIDETNEDFMESIMDFILMRKMRKRPLTERAMRRLVKRLNELSKGDTELACKMLDKSVDMGWLDVYELKGPTQGFTEDR